MVKINLASIMDMIRRPSPKVVGGEYKIPNFPVVGTQITPTLLTGQYDKGAVINDLRGMLENKFVDRNLSTVCNVSFGGAEYKPVPPREFNDKNGLAAQELRDQIIEFDKMWRLQQVMETSFVDCWACRWSFYEVLFSNIGRWFVPTYWEHLPFHTFSTTPTALAGKEGYIADKLLPGVIYETATRSYKFYQTYDAAKDPVELTSDRLFIVKDQTRLSTDQNSYLSELVDTTRSQGLTRMATNQVVSRAGVPNAVIKVKRPEGDISGGVSTNPQPGSDDTGSSDMGNDYSKWWPYAANYARLQGKDTRVVIPEDYIDIVWPDIKLAINPTEVDHYFIQEIIDHLVPIDVMKQMGTSLSKSSKELLFYLDMMIQAHRSHIGNQVLGFVTQIINMNGYEGWWIDPVWKVVIPSVQDQDKAHSLESYKAQAITTKRFYQETGRPEPTTEELNELYAEWQLRKGPAVGMNLPTGLPTPAPAARAEQDEVDALGLILDGKRQGLIKVLEDLGYFKYLNYKAEGE